MAVGRLFSFAETVPGHEERKRKACDGHKLEYVHWLALLSSDSLSGFYLNGGSQSLRRGLTACLLRQHLSGLYYSGAPLSISIFCKFSRIWVPLLKYLKKRELFSTVARPQKAVPP